MKAEKMIELKMKSLVKYADKIEKIERNEDLKLNIITLEKDFFTNELKKQILFTTVKEALSQLRKITTLEEVEKEEKEAEKELLETTIPVEETEIVTETTIPVEETETETETTIPVEETEIVTETTIPVEETEIEFIPVKSLVKYPIYFMYKDSRKTWIADIIKEGEGYTVLKGTEICLDVELVVARKEIGKIAEKIIKESKEMEGKIKKVNKGSEVIEIQKDVKVKSLHEAFQLITGRSRGTTYKKTMFLDVLWEVLVKY